MTMAKNDQVVTQDESLRQKRKRRGEIDASYHAAWHNPLFLNKAVYTRGGLRACRTLSRRRPPAGRAAASPPCDMPPIDRGCKLRARNTETVANESAEKMKPLASPAFRPWLRRPSSRWMLEGYAVSAPAHDCVKHTSTISSDTCRAPHANSAHFLKKKPPPTASLQAPGSRGSLASVCGAHGVFLNATRPARAAPHSAVPPSPPSRSSPWHFCSASASHAPEPLKGHTMNLWTAERVEREAPENSQASKSHDSVTLSAFVTGRRHREGYPKDLSDLASASQNITTNLRDLAPPDRPRDGPSAMSPSVAAPWSGLRLEGVPAVPGLSLAEIPLEHLAEASVDVPDSCRAANQEAAESATRPVPAYEETAGSPLWVLSASTTAACGTSCCLSPSGTCQVLPQQSPMPGWSQPPCCKSRRRPSLTSPEGRPEKMYNAQEEGLSQDARASAELLGSLLPDSWTARNGQEQHTLRPHAVQLDVVQTPISRKVFATASAPAATPGAADTQSSPTPQAASPLQNSGERRQQRCAVGSDGRIAAPARERGLRDHDSAGAFSPSTTQGAVVQAWDFLAAVPPTEWTTAPTDGENCQEERGRRTEAAAQPALSCSESLSAQGRACEHQTPSGEGSMREEQQGTDVKRGMIVEKESTKQGSKAHWIAQENAHRREQREEKEAQHLLVRSGACCRSLSKLLQRCSEEERQYFSSQGQLAAPHRQEEGVWTTSRETKEHVNLRDNAHTLAVAAADAAAPPAIETQDVPTHEEEQSADALQEGEDDDLHFYPFDSDGDELQQWQRERAAWMRESEARLRAVGGSSCKAAWGWRSSGGAESPPACASLELSAGGGRTQELPSWPDGCESSFGQLVLPSEDADQKAWLQHEMQALLREEYQQRQIVQRRAEQQLEALQQHPPLERPWILLAQQQKEEELLDKHQSVFQRMEERLLQKHQRRIQARLEQEFKAQTERLQEAQHTRPSPGEGRRKKADTHANAQPLRPRTALEKKRFLTLESPLTCGSAQWKPLRQSRGSQQQQTPPQSSASVREEAMALVTCRKSATAALEKQEKGCGMQAKSFNTILEQPSHLTPEPPPPEGKHRQENQLKEKGPYADTSSQGCGETQGQQQQVGQRSDDDPCDRLEPLAMREGDSALWHTVERLCLASEEEGQAFPPIVHAASAESPEDATRRRPHGERCVTPAAHLEEQGLLEGGGATDAVARLAAAESLSRQSKRRCSYEGCCPTALSPPVHGRQTAEFAEALHADCTWSGTGTPPRAAASLAVPQRRPPPQEAAASETTRTSLRLALPQTAKSRLGFRQQLHGKEEVLAETATSGQRQQALLRRRETLTARREGGHQLKAALPLRRSYERSCCGGGSLRGGGVEQDASWQQHASQSPLEAQAPPAWTSFCHQQPAALQAELHPYAVQQEAVFESAANCQYFLSWGMRLPPPWDVCSAPEERVLAGCSACGQYVDMRGSLEGVMSGNIAALACTPRLTEALGFPLASSGGQRDVGVRLEQTAQPQELKVAADCFPGFPAAQDDCTSFLGAVTSTTSHLREATEEGPPFALDDDLQWSRCQNVVATVTSGGLPCGIVQHSSSEGAFDAKAELASVRMAAAASENSRGVLATRLQSDEGGERRVGENSDAERSAASRDSSAVLLRGSFGDAERQSSRVWLAEASLARDLEKTAAAHRGSTSAAPTAANTSACAVSGPLHVEERGIAEQQAEEAERNARMASLNCSVGAIDREEASKGKLPSASTFNPSAPVFIPARLQRRAERNPRLVSHSGVAEEAASQASSLAAGTAGAAAQRQEHEAGSLGASSARLRQASHAGRNTAAPSPVLISQVQKELHPQHRHPQRFASCEHHGVDCRKFPASYCGARLPGCLVVTGGCLQCWQLIVKPPSFFLIEQLFPGGPAAGGRGEKADARRLP
ncbi:hypothetical protein cyc_00795 [Cyclospora cayetanensis]|uniref:Uncharacterized protein n=1 Tax=Cyclospora cayetanensis TaxID=88456 RepID=A0A1D3D884_9EIME|nr:hypothetical protein cyc_00795 [Cyclospora cayetanensis]